MNELQLPKIAEKYAERFLRELRQNSEVEQRCEWTCILWLKEHYASDAKKLQIRFQQAKERLSESGASSDRLMPLLMEAQFRNTIGQAYAQFFGDSAQTCGGNEFHDCPYLRQRDQFLRQGTLANAFTALLQKATNFSMLEKHPEDNGLLDDDYGEVFGINLTNFQDLQDSLRAGRFEKLFQAVAKRAAGMTVKIMLSVIALTERTLAEQLAKFAVDVSYEDLSDVAKRELKIRVLDAFGCAFGALDGEPIRALLSQIKDFGGTPHCTLIASGKTAPDLAAFYNGALVRYLDFNDSYLAKGETCHPSDNIAPILAAAEYAKCKGYEFLSALAVAYQVQCRLSDAAPVRNKGFDHTTQGSYAVAAGASKVLRLDEDKTANAIGISGTALNALRVTRTGRLSNWKGLAYPFTAFAATHAAFLAMRGITGPSEVFEGNKGFMEAIAGKFEIDWSKEDLERVTRTIMKKYNAEIHSQSAVEAILEVKSESRFIPKNVGRIDVEIFDVAYNIIGGGEEGKKRNVQTKEEADHSLPYILSVAILDDQVMPEQYLPQRIVRADVQELLRKVKVTPRRDYSERFPEEMPCRVIIHLTDGTVLEKEKSDYVGFFTKPMGWDRIAQKFDNLSARHISEATRSEIEKVVANLEDYEISDLTRLLVKEDG